MINEQLPAEYLSIRRDGNEVHLIVKLKTPEEAIELADDLMVQTINGKIILWLNRD